MDEQTKPDSKKQPWLDKTRRQALRFLVGLAMLVFAGYAIGWRSMHLDPEANIVLLGENQVYANTPAAFRLVASGKAQKAPEVDISNLELSLQQGNRQVLLSKRLGEDDVVDCNVKIPDWPEGSAQLIARAETSAGRARLEAQITLQPSPGQKVLRAGAKHFRFTPPSAEWETQPKWISLPTTPWDQEADIPASLQVYPLGGSLSSLYDHEILVRAIGNRGRPVRGELLYEEQSVKTNSAGLASLTIDPEAQGKLRLRFLGAGGVLEGILKLKLDQSPISMRLRPNRLAIGHILEIQIRSPQTNQRVYIQGHWAGGLGFLQQVTLNDGKAGSVVKIPAGMLGPLLVSAQLDPLAQSDQALDAVWVGKYEVPSVNQALAGLAALRIEEAYFSDEAFWSEASGLLEGGALGLKALLSRLRYHAQKLPILTTSTQQAELNTEWRSSMANFSIGLTGVTSALFLAILAWCLLWGLRTRRAVIIGRVVFGILGSALIGGWIWLYIACS